MRAVIILLLLLFGCVSQPKGIGSTEQLQSDIRSQQPPAARLDNATLALLERFKASDYIQSRWNESCVRTLNDADYLVILATLTSDAQGKRISCVRGPAYDPPELTDIMPEWYACGAVPDSYSGLAERVYDELHRQPYPLVHLEDTITRDASKSYILIKDCHRQSDSVRSDAALRYCQEHDILNCAVKSVVYAVMDDAGAFYW